MLPPRPPELDSPPPPFEIPPKLFIAKAEPMPVAKLFELPPKPFELPPPPFELPPHYFLLIDLSFPFINL